MSTALDKELFLDLDGVNLSDYAVNKHEIKGAVSHTSALMDYFASDPNSKGCWLPFNSSGNLRFRRGECAIWAGPNFSGKSSLLTMSLLYWLRGEKFADTEQKFLLISPEMSPLQNLARCVQQCVAKLPGQVTDSDVAAACAFLGNRLLILDHVGQVDIDDMVNTIYCAQQEHGITGVVLDNLSVMRLPGGSFDSNYAQQDLLSQLIECSRSSQVAMHVVAHTRKPSAGEKMDRYSIKGSGAISDLADNVLLVERIFAKEKALQNINLDPEDREKWERTPDSRLIVAKQRHGTAWTGDIRLFYDPYSMRWSEQKNASFRAFEECEALSELGQGNSRGYQSW